MREILVPHDESRGPLSAVRRMLVHSSISELQQLGVYERYCELVDRAALARINQLIGPGWMPVELALAHYDACDQLRLSDAIVTAAGVRAGENLSSALLVAGLGVQDRSPWSFIGAFSRMGRRIYEGGSAQYVKLGEKILEIEHVRNPLFSFHYYRVAHGGFLRKSFGSLGADIHEVTFAPYRAEGQIEVRLSWR